MRTRVFLTFLCAASLHAAGIPEGGRNVLPADWQAAAEARGSAKLWKAERADFGERGKGWRLEVLDGQAGPHQLQLTCVLEGEVKSGDRMLLAFEGRCLPDASPDGKGRAQAFVEIKEPPDYEKLGQDAFDVTGEWQTVFIPFPANAGSKPGLTHATILPGGRKQTLEIANVRLFNYGPDFDLAKLPRPCIRYPGREPDAPWRKAALARIEKERTTEIAVEVVDAAGKAIPGAKVTMELRRHAFAFGTAVKAKYLAGTDEQSQRYREVVDRNFSAIVLENDLKPFGWEGGKSNQGKEYRRQWTIGALTWAKQRKMRVRGHYLAWGPWEPWSEQLKDQPQALRDQVLLHLLNVMHGADGLVDEWDAVNHPVGWSSPRSTVDQVLGPGFYAEVFQTARSLSSVPLFINEDQVFRPGRQQEEFYECIRDLIARGARPDGIGNQAHFHSSFLPAPEEMLRISDRFAALVPNLELTEFDIITNGDEQLQADWLRDVLIMAYSHPAYTGVILWVFWEGAGWKPECALWRRDWSEKPNAKVWRELVGGAWRTKVEGQTGPDGGFAVRGHRGLYGVIVEVEGKRKAAQFTTEDGAGPLRVVCESATAPVGPPPTGVPSEQTCRVRHVPGAGIVIDGRVDEPVWGQAVAERNFTFPWKEAPAPETEFRALCDDDALYFTFRVQDTDIVVLEQLRDEEDAVFEDRPELYFALDDGMKEYYCIEVDSRGRAFDYRGSFYRQIDPKWNCPGLETAAAQIDQGYAVEGRIPWAGFEALGFAPLRPGTKIRCGLFRAEFSHDRSGRSVEQKETIHNRGRKLEGPPPIEEWMAWVDPRTPEPDFHVPSSLGWLEIVK